MQYRAQIWQIGGGLTGVGLQTWYKVYRDTAAVTNVVTAMNRSRVATITQVRIQVGRRYKGGNEVRGVWGQGVQVWQYRDTNKQATKGSEQSQEAGAPDWSIERGVSSRAWWPEDDGLRSCLSYSRGGV